jgi:membrane-associated protease RseP (regulator of RpoE activity)
LDPKIEGYVHAAGMALLMLLMLIVAFKDIFTIIAR